ncbi:acetyl-CoA C-acetyltransferase [Paeniglutamicibacter sulfureus]|uniref:Probable acetyl-CoA acetyltransferase n=1 Tax=Paeniglutamicibacter sulfureus TaxID=43666 RepID=A0ABU2BME0_9MICC|nr:acetyl-CoA C-acetyltransferase [Paeniglutamicibacter sulfureus]MDO2935482.1 acetyl-CoA C-acetyltransferase [Paeniglutamicibacter sulfureus]MDR7359821.1 acetyl-CoA C-acetyltransferase [Paeniglutamicibacter sulfureus]
MSSPRDAVLVAGARTPFGRLNGQLSSLSAVELGAAAIRGALERSGIPAAEVQAVIMGHVVQAGCGQNPARQSAITAGIGWDVNATTLNKVCLSGLAAITDAARLIRVGDADVVVAGGQESMSQTPHLLPGSRQGWTYGNISAIDSVAHDGLTDAFDGNSMGMSTEAKNSVLGLTRTQQDEVAAASHQRAAAAINSGVFAEEIVTVSIPQRKGGTLVVDTDEGVRPNATIETLAGLRPAFAKDGTITAGNSSPLSDGAAAVIVTSREYARSRNLEILATIGAAGQVAGPDNSLHSQPSNSITAALKKQGWATSDLDFIEINEAFGAVACQSLKDLGYPLDKTNIHGGAIALGHPIGASGARLALTAAMELKRRGSGKTAVSLCGGGGQGDALLLSREA